MAKYVSSPIPVADLVPDIVGPDDKGRVWVHFRSGGMRAGISFEAKDGVAQCIRAWRDDLIKALASPPKGDDNGRDEWLRLGQERLRANASRPRKATPLQVQIAKDSLESTRNPPTWQSIEDALNAVFALSLAASQGWQMVPKQFTYLMRSALNNSAPVLWQKPLSPEQGQAMWDAVLAAAPAGGVGGE